MRARRFTWLLWGAPLGAALLLLVQSCSGAQTPRLPEAASNPPVSSVLELWVDSHAEEGGDGSAGRPLRRLAPALARSAPKRLVHLASGLYEGPFVAPDGTSLQGGGAAVLTGPGGVTVLRAEGGVRLERLLLQGGTLGLEANGVLLLADVRFSGQRKGALALEAGASVEARRSLFEATVSGGVGVLLEARARAELFGCTFEGPWQRALEARAPESLTVANSTVRGAVTALHLRDGRAELSDVTISEGRGPGLYVAGGTLVLHRVDVRGHEYALLTGAGAVVEAEALSSTGADRAGVGVVKAKAHFRGLTISAAGTFGGLQCVSSDVRAEELRVEGAAGVGVSQRDGSLQLDGAVVTGTREPQGTGGNGVEVRGGRATLAHLNVREASGACLLAAEGADVLLSHATLEHCHTAGLAVETGGHLSAMSVTVHFSEGPGAVATSDGELVLRGFQAVSTDGVVWAECASGARVRTWEVSGAVPEQPCIEPLADAPPPGGP